MNAKTVEAAVARATRLVKGVQEPWKSLAFPVVLEKALQSNQDSLGEPPNTRARPARSSPSKPTRSSTLRSLIADGWFRQNQRKLADVRKELKNRGLPTKITTLPSLVLPLVLEGKLKRKSIQQGEKEFYVYYT